MKNFLTRRNDQDFISSFFDTAIDDFFQPTLFSGVKSCMRTDVKSDDKGTSLNIEIPGYEKNDISVEFEKGYLTVSATRKDSEADNGFVKRERSLSCKRSYYVGEDVDESGIKAKYENGVLNLSLPRTEKVNLKSRIQID
ncbi:MAG: Hsp20 family protein [Clostridiales bacterium]|nr:Hsp20 family protein [Clostridiales bacterium]